jgi:hypothetical protein
MASEPKYRVIVGFDIEGSTRPGRTNPIREEVRHTLYGVVEKSLADIGMAPDACESLDRGDGFLILIRPIDPNPSVRLLADFFDSITTRLDEHNADHSDEERARREVRVRAVHHAGDVIEDENGACGEALDTACRLLDSPRLKRCLRESATSLVLVVSGDIYSAVVRHEYPGISRERFELWFRVRVGGVLHQGWIRRAAEPGNAVA